MSDELSSEDLGDMDTQTKFKSLCVSGPGRGKFIVWLYAR